MKLRNVDVSRRLWNSMLKASRTCSPGFIENSSSIVSVAHRRPHRGASNVGSRVRTPAICWWWRSSSTHTRFLEKLIDSREWPSWSVR